MQLFIVVIQNLRTNFSLKICRLLVEEGLPFARLALRVSSRSVSMMIYLKVKVTLRLAVYRQSVRLGVKLLLYLPSIDPRVGPDGKHVHCIAMDAYCYHVLL
jgi:hypothetical protein